ncbi:MAG: hypothetical protein QG608_3757 [Actinomycetota bacterium]|nr:hypothetical protein [Actinomycetota bacterium]
MTWFLEIRGTGKNELLVRADAFDVLTGIISDFLGVPEGDDLIGAWPLRDGRAEALLALFGLEMGSGCCELFVEMMDCSMCAEEVTGKPRSLHYVPSGVVRKDGLEWIVNAFECEGEGEGDALLWEVSLSREFFRLCRRLSKDSDAPWMTGACAIDESQGNLAMKILQSDLEALPSQCSVLVRQTLGLGRSEKARTTQV